MVALTPLLALLGPTNTGKTFLAIETMGEHDDGVIGLPLRLLAREVYETLCLRHGRDHCALVTGEEKIVPDNARYFACTVEAMPSVYTRHGVERPFSFVAVDEIQLCADRERGHTFTDRLLHRRGTKTTMVLGADTIAPLLRKLFPDVVIERRPRLSRLSWAGEKKLARLPPRSVVVAFSIADVYAIAERVRAHHGGAAVVTGALSPSTRNAQVAMFQRGEVDVLVATDAIGMGLNLDVAHVAFAAVRKFDGDDVRELTEPELAQIAGRAGRHTKDGTFGVTDGLAPFPRDVIARLEHHEFAPLKKLCWRNSDLDTSSLSALHTSLRAPPVPALIGLVAHGRPASDLLALERLMHHDLVVATVRTPADVLSFFEHCQIPDFARLAPDDHASVILQVWSMTKGQGAVTEQWLQARHDELDDVDGDVETLVARLARVRILAYVVNKPTWVTDTARWQKRARDLEDRLSDALHERLQHRFVDQLHRSVVENRVQADVDEAGVVVVAGESIGRLQGLRFVADKAEGTDTRQALRNTAAARGLRAHVEARVQAMLSAAPGDFTIDVEHRHVLFNGEAVGRIVKGRSRLWPRAVPLSDGNIVDDGQFRAKLEEQLTTAVRAFVEKSLPLVVAIDPDAMPGGARAFAWAVKDGLGVAERAAVEAVAGVADVEAKKALFKKKVRLGFLDVFVDDAFKDKAIRARALLIGVWRDVEVMPVVPPPGASSFLIGERPVGFVTSLGFRVGEGPNGLRAFRADLVDDVGVLLKTMAPPCAIPSSSVEKLGCSRDEVVAVLRQLGYDVDAEGLLQKRRFHRRRTASG
ncbi:MAG TPA: helicase-related protein [Myxococcota bacterium]